MTIFGIPIFPEQASAFAKDVDALYFFIVATCAFFAIGVSIAVVLLGIKYRKTHAGQIGARIEGNLPLELLWSVIPTIIAMFMFGWGATVFYHLRRPPDEALNLYAVGKQWMWKFQHLEGQREINELHVPVDRPVKLIMTSQDVIHSFFVPAFRLKRDVLPDQQTEAWFQATKTGTFHLLCTEYCGTDHARMLGRVIVMEPEAYARWLSAQPEGDDLAHQGERLFSERGCAGCHARIDPFGFALERYDAIGRLRTIFDSGETP